MLHIKEAKNMKLRKLLTLCDFLSASYCMAQGSWQVSTVNTSNCFSMINNIKSSALLYSLFLFYISFQYEIKKIQLKNEKWKKKYVYEKQQQKKSQSNVERQTE